MTEVLQDSNREPRELEPSKHFKSPPRQQVQTTAVPLQTDDNITIEVDSSKLGNNKSEQFRLKKFSRLRELSNALKKRCKIERTESLVFFIGPKVIGHEDVLGALYEQHGKEEKKLQISVRRFEAFGNSALL